MASLIGLHQDTPVNKQLVRTASIHRVTVAVKPPTPTIAAQPQPEITAAVETPPPPVVTPAPPTTPEGMMSAAGISQSDFPYVEYIVSHESTWNIYATEPTTGAYGLCQSLPAYKMASAGSDWQTNGVTQLIWCNSYAQSAYGGWYNAYIHWVNNHWW